MMIVVYLRPKAINTLFCSRPLCSMHVEREWDMCMCVKRCFHLPSVAGGAVVEVDPVIQMKRHSWVTLTKILSTCTCLVDFLFKLNH